MGKIIYINKIREFFEKNKVVSINSIKKFVDDKKYAYLLISNMIKRGEIKRLTKGFYTKYEDPSLIVFCFKPSYIGLQDALSIHNLWEQETNPIVITTKIIRQGIRKVFDSNVIIKRISSKYFFGVEYIKQDDFYIPVSDIEKTFIDMVYFRQNLDKALLKNFKNKINIKKLKKYLKRYPKSISKAVLKKYS